MQFIDLADALTFFRREPGVIERLEGLKEVAAENDLTVRAARLLAQSAEPNCGVAIHLNKRIPMQAGLGGGSSDAATVLVALNRLWNLNLTIDELAELGLKLGADVPFFVRGHASWMEGIGERLTLQDFPETTYLVVKPAAAVGTAEIFQAPELTRNSPVTTIRAFLEGGGRNDCLATVSGRYPEVAEALDWLQSFGEAKLTGTGSCVFAVLSDPEAARDALARVPARWRGFLVRGLNRSPLLDRLRS
jgi:4-diphosphocytidyl-2-C-methyl-D-erythritol kinase